MRFWGIILSFALIMQILLPAILVINFQINRQEIVLNQCEKRFEKINVCQGYCHIRKIINEENQNKSSSSIRLKQAEPAVNLIETEANKNILFSDELYFLVFDDSQKEMQIEISTPPPQFG